MLAVRLSYPPATDVSCGGGLAKSVGEGSAWSDDPSGRILWLGGAVSERESSSSLSLTLAAGKWTTAISSHGTSPQAAGETTQGDFTVSQTFQEGDALGIVFADNSLVSADRRFIARDLAGKEHSSNTVNASFTRNVVLRSVNFLGLTAKEVRDIRYDIRPYTDVIEFANVSLKPGLTTRPRVSTGKINPGIIAADNPGPGEYYVGGAVTRVGVYSLTARQITLKQAVIAAGVDTKGLEGVQVELIRRLAGNQERVSTFDLAAIFQGTQPDHYLQPNDVVQVRSRALRAGDRLAVSITDLVAPNVAAEFRMHVADDGQVHPPLAGGVRVAGLDTAQAAKAMNQAYYRANLLRDATIEIRVIDDDQQPAVQAGPLQPGDLVLLRTWENNDVGSEKASTLRIAPDGTITPPQLPPLKVSGLQEYEAELAMTKAYQRAGVRGLGIQTLERLRQ